MAFEYKIDDKTGRVIVKVNGKPAKAGFMRGFKKAQATNYFILYTQPHVAQNRFTGEEVHLNGLEYTIYEWAINWCNLYEQGLDAQAPVQAFDDMKYFLLHLSPKAYMTLLD